MKNQYVGDVSDYLKYGILRALSGRGARSSFIAWLLTPDDAGTDGRRLEYLEDADGWKGHDPHLFDQLHRVVRQEKARTVAAIEAALILPNARFYNEPVPSRRSDRESFGQRMLDAAKGADLVFFDPDNGMEVPSRPPGHRNSNKYLLWRELAETYLAGHSVLIYQHFARESRNAHVARLAARMVKQTGAIEVFTLRASHVVFLMLPQHGVTDYYAERMDRLAQAWRGRIEVALEAVA